MTKIQDYVRFRDLTIINPQRVKLIVPAFSFPVPVWAGASTRLAHYPIGNGYFFNLKKVIKSFGSNFVAAINYVDDNNVSIRYKLWDDSRAVLYFPVYDGDVIGLNASVEIWSVNSAAAPTLAAEKILETSVLAFQNLTCQTCCTNPDVSQLLSQANPEVIPPYGAYCDPFCDLLLTP